MVVRNRTTRRSGSDVAYTNCRMRKIGRRAVVESRWMRTSAITPEAFSPTSASHGGAPGTNHWRSRSWTRPPDVTRLGYTVML